MARPIRIEFENAMYHITNRGGSGQNIFFDDADRLRFLEFLYKVKKKYSLLIYGYIMMDNHYHLQIETLLPNLSRAIQYLQSVYAIYFNNKYNKRGHLFERRFRALLIDRETYFLELNRYINLNAVRAGIVKDVLDYKWCGIQEYVGNSEFNIIDKEYVLSCFDTNDSTEAFKKYLDFCRAGLDKKWSEFSKKIYGKTILGSKKFTNKVKQLILDNTLTDSISEKRKLVNRKSKDRILQIVDDYYKRVAPKLRNEIVNMKIYFLVNYTDMKLSDIGALFGNMKVSALSRRNSRIKEKIENTEWLYERTLAIKKQINEM